MKKTGKWISYDVGPVYTLLSQLFPAMKLQYNMFLCIREKDARETSFFTIWEYIDVNTQIDWDTYNFPVVVFYNGGAPDIKIFDKTRMGRAFGESIILGSKYLLVGVITLLYRVSNDETRSGHYVAYIRKKSGSWYHYNDVGGKFFSIRSLPRTGVWEDNSMVMPAMYFYAKG